MKKLTPTAIRALLILRDKKPRNADDFAKLMWPDSLMHSKVSNQGHGATRGKAAWLVGGSYLGRLRKAGLITVNYTWMRRNGEPIAYPTDIADDLLRNMQASKKKG